MSWIIDTSKSHVMSHDEVIIVSCSFRCVVEDRKVREASQSSPSSVKRPILPAFPIISDSDSDLRSELGEDEDEEVEE